MDVVQNQQHRPVERHGSQEGSRRLEQPEPVALALERRRLRLVRKDLGELGQQVAELTGTSAQPFVEGVWLQFTDEGS